MTSYSFTHYTAIGDEDVRITYDYDASCDDVEIADIEIEGVDLKWRDAEHLRPLITDSMIRDMRLAGAEKSREAAFWDRADYEYERRRDDGIGY